MKVGNLSPTAMSAMCCSFHCFEGLYTKPLGSANRRFGSVVNKDATDSQTLRGSNSWSNFPATISCPALRRSFSNSGTRRSPVRRPDVNARNRLWRSYCLRTADKALDVWYGRSPLLRLLQIKRRADERARIAYPCSLRVIGQALQGVAEACKSRILKPISFLRLAQCCTVLRSRWCQSGVNRGA